MLGSGSNIWSIVENVFQIGANTLRKVKCTYRTANTFIDG